jgi:hypothetical protein
MIKNLYEGEPPKHHINTNYDSYSNQLYYLSCNLTAAQKVV